MHLKTTERNHLCWFVSFIASEFVFGVCILFCISNSFCIRNLCCTLLLKPLRKPSLNGCTGFLCGIPFDCSISPLFAQLWPSTTCSCFLCKIPLGCWIWAHLPLLSLSAGGAVWKLVLLSFRVLWHRVGSLQTASTKYFMTLCWHDSTSIWRQFPPKIKLFRQNMFLHRAGFWQLDVPRFTGFKKVHF